MCTYRRGEQQNGEGMETNKGKHIQRKKTRTWKARGTRKTDSFTQGFATVLEKSAMFRDFVQIGICENNVMPWSPGVTKALLPIVEGTLRSSMSISLLILEYQRDLQDKGKQHALVVFKSWMVRGVLYVFNWPVCKVQQACRRVVRQVNISEVCDSTSHLPKSSNGFNKMKKAITPDR